MRVLGISGSPRRNGNTEILLDKALEGAKSKGASIEKIILNELDFRACQECGGCHKAGVCVLTDDMAALYKKMSAAHAVILASPIFFGTISAQLKAMIDRFNCVWVARNALKMPPAEHAAKGVFLCAGGYGKKEFFENAKKIIKIFFATLGIEYSKELFLGGMEGKGDILSNKKALADAYDIGREI